MLVAADAFIWLRVEALSGDVKFIKLRGYPLGIAEHICSLYSPAQLLIQIQFANVEKLLLKILSKFILIVGLALYSSVRICICPSNA